MIKIANKRVEPITNTYYYQTIQVTYEWRWVHLWWIIWGWKRFSVEETVWKSVVVYTFAAMRLRKKYWAFRWFYEWRAITSSVANSFLKWTSGWDSSEDARLAGEVLLIDKTLYTSQSVSSEVVEIPEAIWVEASGPEFEGHPLFPDHFANVQIPFEKFMPTEIMIAGDEDSIAFLS